MIRKVNMTSVMVEIPCHENIHVPVLPAWQQASVSDALLQRTQCILLKVMYSSLHGSMHLIEGVSNTRECW